MLRGLLKANTMLRGILKVDASHVTEDEKYQKCLGHPPRHLTDDNFENPPSMRFVFRTLLNMVFVLRTLLSMVDVW